MNIITSSVIARPIGTQRQAIVSYGDTHIVVGSSSIRDTLSDHIRSTDLLLAALATDCTFVCQDEALRLKIPLNSLTTTVRWTYTSETPGIVVRFAWSGPNSTQARLLVESVEAKSQTYRLLARATPIQIEIVS